MIVFGPVPSRRLGYSLGINHIPPKHCPYSCVYCQVGRTSHMESKRRSFYPVEQIMDEVRMKVSESSRVGQTIDFLTLVPDGEPTLDINLGTLITELKGFGIPIAVISNSALIDQPCVQEELSQADWVSLKVDTLDEDEWHRINRPIRNLSLLSILNGIRKFRARFSGKLVTETMLVNGINDHERSIYRLCDFLLELQPFKSYLSIPIRPPAEPWVKAPNPASSLRIFQIASDRIPFVDLLYDIETGDFSSTGNLVEDILSITAVHPLREEALRRMVDQAGEKWNTVEDLVNSMEILCVKYRNERFYLRNTTNSITKNE